MRVPFPFAPESSGRGGTSPDSQAKSGPRPSIPYSHLWTDDRGVSHQQRCELTEWELKGVGGAAPQWNDKQERTEATVVFTVQPVGWVGDWHENPAPQWIIVLSGRWWIESMDGTRIEQGEHQEVWGGSEEGPAAARSLNALRTIRTQAPHTS